MAYIREVLYYPDNYSLETTFIISRRLVIADIFFPLLQVQEELAEFVCKCVRKIHMDFISACDLSFEGFE